MLKMPLAISKNFNEENKEDKFSWHIFRVDLSVALSNSKNSVYAAAIMICTFICSNLIQKSNTIYWIIRRYMVY